MVNKNKRVMSKVEQYIQDYTRHCSNEMIAPRHEYQSWLTPDHARRVAEIAREETIEKTLKWLEFCRGFILTEMDIEQFKKYMEE